jgi:hypothetical protein
MICILCYCHAVITNRHAVVSRTDEAASYEMLGFRLEMAAGCLESMIKNTLEVVVGR